MTNVLIVVFLVAAVAVAVCGVVRRIRRGSGCCGERDAPEKKVRVRDKNKADYPYAYVLTVDGMHCSNCVRRVENALNSMGDVWATASLEKRQVSVLSKTEKDASALGQAVTDAGYTVLSVER